MNLLKETLEDIKNSDHTVADIVFIGSEVTGHCCDWQEFEVLANTDYDCGFGAQKIARDLIIVFSDGQRMWRHEYDGSEQWHYSVPVKIPLVKKKITTLCNGGMWETLAEMNG